VPATAPAPRVLVLDGLWNKTVAAVRSFGRRGFFVGVGERTRLAPAMVSRYCSRRFLHPSPFPDPRPFLRALEEELRAGRYDVVIPMEFATQTLLARHRDRVERYARFPFADAELAGRVGDKGELMKFAADRGFEIPATFFPSGPDEADAMAAELPYPVLVKPRSSSGGRGIALAPDRRAFPATYRRVHRGFPRPIVQELLPAGGDAIGVAALFNYASVPRASLVYRRMREYPVTGGPSTLRESIRDDDVRRSAERLLSALRWVGVAMAEFKVDPRDGRPRLLEVNPRFWGSLHHAIASGVDFPYLLYRMAMDGDVEPPAEYRVGARTRSFLHGELMHFVTSPARFRMKPGLLDFTVPDDLLSSADPWPVLGRLSSVVAAVYDRELRRAMFG
jgi:predicted ATP-grasp superfamily ATP-dependent carboligase